MQNKQENTYELLKKAKSGNNEAKEILAAENMGLVYSIAKKFLNRGVEFEDLVQIGSIGLINAMEKFDESYHVMFSTYAVPLIVGEIKRFLRDNGPIKASRSYRILSIKAAAVREKILNDTGKEPTISDIASVLNVDCEELSAAFEATCPPESIYKTVDESGKVLLIDKICGGVDNEEKIINKIALKELILSLQPRERKIIILRYFKDKKQAEIAKMLGISQVQVSRLEKQILNKIREKIC